MQSENGIQKYLFYLKKPVICSNVHLFMSFYRLSILHTEVFVLHQEKYLEFAGKLMYGFISLKICFSGW